MIFLPILLLFISFQVSSDPFDTFKSKEQIVKDKNAQLTLKNVALSIGMHLPLQALLVYSHELGHKALYTMSGGDPKTRIFIKASPLASYLDPFSLTIFTPFGGGLQTKMSISNGFVTPKISYRGLAATAAAGPVSGLLAAGIATAGISTINQMEKGKSFKEALKESDKNPLNLKKKLDESLIENKYSTKYILPIIGTSFMAWLNIKNLIPITIPGKNSTDGGLIVAALRNGRLPKTSFLGATAIIGLYSMLNVIFYSSLFRAYQAAQNKKELQK